MFKQFLVLFLLFATFNVNAQVEFAPIGAIWHYNTPVDLNEDPALLDYFTIESTGDTLVNGLTMRKVGPHLMHQQGHKVYYWAADSLNLIYDFSIEEGNTITLNMKGCDTGNGVIYKTLFHVDQVTTVLVNNQPLKQFKGVAVHTLPNGLEYTLDYTYMERIGSLRTMVEDYFFCYTIIGALPEWVRCYTENGQVWQTPRFQFYGQPDCTYKATNSTRNSYEFAQFEISPNPVSTQLQLQTGDWTPQTARITDLTGRTVRLIRQPDALLEVGDLPLGYYWLQLTDADGRRGVQGFVRAD
jgi:hypothetical protein